MSNKEPIRVAEIIGKWVGGGVEAVVMNYYRNIDHNKIQFDFICDNDSTNIPYEEIKSLGGKVILIPPYQKVLKYQKELQKVLKEGNYKIVHSHINTLSVFPLYAAKKVGVPVRIAHSHSTTNKAEWKKNIMKQILRPFSKKYANEYFACTEHAGRWLFGNKTFNDGKVFVMNNAIELEKFSYNKSIRNTKRKELGLKEDNLVIGHIGRFVTQKNHNQLIDIFSELQKKENKAVLILVGQGPLQEDIKEKVKKLGLTKNVIFLGQRKDVNELYQAFDLFILPSIYEGLGMVAIEAQCAGLPCVCSTDVPEIAKVTKNLEFVSLRESSDKWSEVILKSIKNYKREDYTKQVKLSGYDIKNEVKILENNYLNYVNNSKKIIELFGIPSCGKSYYATNCLKEYININEKYIYSKNRIIRNIKKIINIIQLFITNPRLSIESFKLIKKVKFKSNKTSLKMKIYLLSTLNICKKALKSEDNKKVIEEGMLQVLWGICYNSNYTEEFIREYYQLYSKYICTNIYLFDITQLELKKRLLERNDKGGSELEHQIKENIEVLDKAVDIQKNIIEFITTKNYIVKTIKE